MAYPNPHNGIIRQRKWVCYDRYFDTWQAKVAAYDSAKDQECQFQGRDSHGLHCGLYLVSIEPIEED